MAKWAFIVTLFYIILVMLLLIPSVCWLVEIVAGNGHLPELHFTGFSNLWGQWYWWVITGIIVLLQAMLLLFPISRNKERPKPQRALWVSIIVSGILFSLLLIGVFASVTVAIWGDDQQNPAIIVWGVFMLVSWFVWAFIFYWFAKTTNVDSFMACILKWLIKGSVLELLIAIPCHVIVRHKNECCAPGVTAYGLVTGLAVMALAFGPGIAFLILKRARGLKLNKPQERISDQISDARSYPYFKPENGSLN